MYCLIVFLGLISGTAAQQTFTIVEGKGAQGWCDGFDMAPNSDLGTPTTAEECFNNCKATYDTTVAIDFWDINHEGRHAGNICWCQDACACTKPSLPNGGDGTLYIAAGTTKGASCGYDLHMIEEAVTEKGWCLGSDIKLNKTVNNQHQCYAECKALHGSVAVDFFGDRDPKGCFCQSECPCRMASKVGGGHGMLAIAETVTITGDLCYKSKAGIGKQGWCDGMDSAPDASLGTATTAADCFNKCKATYDTTVAIDFWDISHENRNAGNICWCQDACACTKPALPHGGDGTIFVASGTTKGASCGYDLHMIEEAVTEKGWCLGSDIKLNKTVNNQHQCYAECKALHGSVAVDFFGDRDPKGCFCQSECPCRMASKVGGGHGMLAIAETVTITGDLCYKMKAGVGKSGWCPGMDSAPDASLGTPTSAADCFSKCKATYSSTVAVDFWKIDHPHRNSGNICWCQDACACTMASKSDAGDGTLFVANGTVKGESCGFDMKTVVEGNDNAICDGTPTPASQKPGNMYACRSQCEADGFHVSTYYTAGDTACHCQGDCPCKKSSDIVMGPGYLFVKEAMSMPPMCDTEMACGDVKSAYKAGGCCGKPATMLKLR